MVLILMRMRMEHWNFMEVFKNQDDDDGGSWSGGGNDVCKVFCM